MNEFRTFIGIDVSKKTFDAALLRSTHQLTTIHQKPALNPQAPTVSDVKGIRGPITNEIG